MQESFSVMDENGATVIDLVQYEDVLVPKYYVDEFSNRSLVERLQEIKNGDFFHEEDVLLCSFPKTGTHWASNLLTLLFYDGPMEDSKTIIPRNIDCLPLDDTRKIPSPKVIHTHLLPERLPEEVLANTKIVLIVRNPKDTTVSYYNHLKNANEYQTETSWSFFQRIFISGPLAFGPYTKYLKSFEKIIKKGNGTNIHIVYFEDLKQNGLEEMRKIQKHFGLNHSDERLQAIVDRCSINKLRDDVMTGRTEAPVRDVNGIPVIYRKGEVGDWKNYFTVAESEEFDATWEAEMKGSMFHFRYT